MTHSFPTRRSSDLLGGQVAFIKLGQELLAQEREGQDRGKEGADTHAHCERWPLHRAIKARLVLVLEPGHDPSFLLFDRLRQPDRQPRSEERRVGKEGVSTFRSRW